MTKKKICLIGAPGVGKTSLVSRFVKSIFSEKYQASVGAKVDKKTVHANGVQVDLVIWDMAGDSAERLSHSPNLRGSAGHVVVADGTQPETIEDAIRIAHEVAVHHGPVPLVFLVNKSDLTNLWRATPEAVARLAGEKGHALVTSAKICAVLRAMWWWPTAPSPRRSRKRFASRTRWRCTTVPSRWSSS